MDLRIHVVDEHGEPRDALGYLVPPTGKPIGPVSTDACGDLVFSLDAAAASKLSRYELVVHPPPGYWMAFHSSLAEGDQIQLSRLKTPAQPWWKVCVGWLGGPLATGIKIGVVDTAWADDRGIEHVQRVDLAGNSSPLVPTHAAAWRHGEHVVRVISASREHAGRLCGMAPGAEIIAATMGSPDRKPDLGEIQAGIALLALRYRVDLINISAGAYAPTDEAREALAGVLQIADENGTLCIAAAGNTPGNPVAFPAANPHCVAVGAVGSYAWGEPGTFVYRLKTIAARQRAQRKKGKGTGKGGLSLYVSPRSCTGQALTVTAPGVGILSGREDAPSFDLSGTSFAAPIVTGVLACALAADDIYRSSRGAERSAHARNTLKRLCYSAGFAQDEEGDGIPALSEVASSSGS